MTSLSLACCRHEQFVSADQFVDLNGEAQTEEGLRDAHIVEMVRKQDEDTPEGDEDDDEPEPSCCTHEHHT